MDSAVLANNRKQNMKYSITKSQSETSSGRIVTIWNVTDASDGYVFDAFDLRRDAAAWIKQATAA